MHQAFRLPGLLVLFMALALWAGNLVAAEARGLPEFRDLVRENSPSVVNISTTKSRPGSRGQPTPEVPEDHPFRDFFDREREGPGERDPFRGESLGSGVIIAEDGFIITNYHVVEDAEEILVRLSDRRQFDAELLGHDRGTDLALLKIDAGDLPIVRIGESDKLEVGDWVLAIGSPFGFEHSATAGIISAKQRSLPSESYVPFLQTDVAINPGNSGGPLFNLDGEVIGINSHIYSRSGGFMGLSFAIPIELAMSVAHQLRDEGRVTRSWLGVLVQDVDRELAESFDMDRAYGALVSRVISGGPSADAGLETGDIIVRFEGNEVRTSSALPPMVGRMPVDSEVTLEVIRQGELKELTVTLAQLPDQEGQARRQPGVPQDPETEEDSPAEDMLGLSVRDLNEDEVAELDLDHGGVLIEEVVDGPAADGDLMPNDVITMLNQQRVSSVEEFREVVRELPRGRSVPVLVHRDGGPRFFAIHLPDDD